MGSRGKNNKRLVVKIHAALCTYVNELVNKESRLKKLSIFLAEAMHRSYYYLSKIFTTTTGFNLEKYFIRLRMEKTKELITQDELRIAEIALKLGYCSQQIFSTQCKKETDKTPVEDRRGRVPATKYWDRLLPQHFK